MASKFEPRWSKEQLLAQKCNLGLDVSTNIIQLVDDGATIPFITRYRKDKTGNMDVDQIKSVVTQYQEIREVESRIETVCKSVSRQGKMTDELEMSICMSTTMEDVDSLYSLFKPAPKGSYAERARALGLEPLALRVMEGKPASLHTFLDMNTKGLDSVGEIEKGVKHVISDMVAKDKECFDMLRLLCQRSSDFVLSSSKGKGPDKSKKTLTSKQLKNAGNGHKFEQYFSYKVSAKSPPPHVVLALNRGEECKALSVKVNIPHYVKSKFFEYACNKFLRNVPNELNRKMIKYAIEDAFDRLMEPTLCRHTRSELTRFAEKQAIEVFASNVKCVLLSTPTRNKTVLGIDPGFSNGCKFAVISPVGSVLESGVMYLHGNLSRMERTKIKELVCTHRCEIVAIGNGVACRESEQIVSEMISAKAFGALDVVYCIVDECGASIYSVSDQAKKDLPDLDPTLRGAVSIARRLVDPLAEFVKIEPQHLGVGMYQHDVSQNKLQESLDCVVEECVSFVGADLNTCSECLLRRISGLSAAKAKKIIEWRDKNGPFINRHQLLDIKGLGEKAFEQCAGFVRILHSRDRYRQDCQVKKEESDEENAVVKPSGRKRKLESKGKTSKSKKAKREGPAQSNPLDSTAIHPESYHIALSFISQLGLTLDDLGTENFIGRVKEGSSKSALEAFTQKHGISSATTELISQALARPLTYDLREGSQKPLFQREVRSWSDLRPGVVLTGRVCNVTHFGAFVDVGVGNSGLIYGNRIWADGKPRTGDHVSVRVASVDGQRQRLSLVLLEVFNSQNFSKILA